MPPPEQPIRLLLVDDHVVVRYGLRMLLGASERMTVVGEAATQEAAITEAARLAPDIVLMDVRLPDGSGIEACREIRSARPETRVLFLTSFADDEALRATLLAGGQGYLLKEIDENALIRAIEAVAGGQSILDAAMTQRMLAQMSTPAPVGAGPPQILSAQEQKVLALVAEGRTNKQIAATLGLSDKTVRNYLSQIFQKLQVTHRAHAAALYTRRSPDKDKG
ncbi:response regulator [Nevskia ramosa]|uniref:response regulator n=1 Tax=Nevskia ramosa TaxID=64002 RepID=UPI00235210F1|nr:response regulator transcription factor [Nevskia ramosa]